MASTSSSVSGTSLRGQAREIVFRLHEYFKNLKNKILSANVINMTWQGKKIEEEYIETNMIMDEEDDKIVVSLCECSSEDDNAENDGKYCSDSDDY